MKSMLVAVGVVLGLFVCTVAAAGPGPSNLSYDLPAPLLDGQTLEAARGFEIVPAATGFGLMTVEIDVYDANDSVTNVTMACYTRVGAPVTAFTSVTAASCGTDVLTIQQDGATCTLTEATDWAKGATDATARIALAAAAISKCGAKSRDDGTNVVITPGMGKSSIWIYTSDANCAGAQNVAVKGAKIQSCSVVSGTCTSAGASWSAGASTGQPLADTDDYKRWAWRVDVEGLGKVFCTLTPTGGASADLIYAYGRFSVK